MAAQCVRDATPEDCQSIIDMIVELAVYEKEEPSRVKVTKEMLIKDGFGENPWFKCLIVEIENGIDSANGKTTATTTIIGYALFFPTYSTWNGRTMKIEDLYIKHDYRGKGYGTALLKHVTRLALTENCIRVHWCVLDWNQPAIDYYKHIGAEYQAQWRLCSLHHPGMMTFVD